MRTSDDSTPSTTEPTLPRSGQAVLYMRLNTVEQARGRRINACGYIRVAAAAHGDQARSIEEQRQAILDLAERNRYVILQWYTDEGVSGSKLRKQLGWMKLLADVPTAEWVVVLCTDRSRVSRRDSVEDAPDKATLRAAGKRLHTVVEGPVDWGTSVDRVLDTINSEVSNAYSTKLGHATLQGKLGAFLKGERQGGKCPYGYACQVTDPRGNAHSISRKEDFVAPKGWSKILVPGEHEEVEAVRWLFDTYASTDAGMAALASQLNARGIPAPSGPTWQASTVAYILANDIYVGDTRFGRRSSGRFARLQGEQVVEVISCAPAEQESGIVRHDTHQGIVTREVWDRVQAKLNRK